MRKTFRVFPLLMALVMLCACGTGAADPVPSAPDEVTTTSIYRPSGTTANSTVATDSTTIHINRLPSEQGEVTTTTTTKEGGVVTPTNGKTTTTTTTTTAKVTTTTTAEVTTTTTTRPTVDKSKKLIAITVDDGPNSLIGQFNDLLIQYNSRATYFLVGNNVNASYASEMKRAVEHGIELGNHSYVHTNFKKALTNGTMSVTEVQQDLEKANKVVYDLIGYRMKLSRMPNLACNDAILNVCRQLEMPCISRTLPGTGDTDSTSTAQTIIARFLDGDTLLEGGSYTAGDGAIVLCHMKQKTLDALKVIIPALIENGYQLVTVSEMFDAFGYDAIPYNGKLGETRIARQ